MSIRNSLLRTYFARADEGDRSFSATSGPSAGRDVPTAHCAGGRYGVRSSARCCQASYARGVRRTGRSAGLREFQALYRADAGRREECRSPGAGDAFRPFVGNYVRPQQVHSRHAGVRVVESYARYAGRGGGVCFGQAADEDLRRQDADARRFVCPGERSSHRGSVGCADQSRLRSGAVGSGRRRWRRL